MKKIEGYSKTLAQFKKEMSIDTLEICASTKNPGNFYGFNAETNEYALGIKDNAIVGKKIHPEARVSKWETEDGSEVYYLSVPTERKVLFTV
jgi:hypothetical protein